MMSLLLSTAFAGPPVGGDSARALFGEMCGEFQVTDFDLDESATWRFWFDDARGGWSVRVLGERPSADTTALDAGHLAAVQAGNLAFLDGLGFDPDEFDPVSTNQLAAIHTDDGVQGAPEYQATLTTIDWRVDGVVIVGSRISVLRSNEGRLMELLAFWPGLAAADLRATSEAAADLDAARSAGIDATGADLVFMPTRIEGGEVWEGEVYTEVYLDAVNPLGGTRPSSRLFQGGQHVGVP